MDDQKALQMRPRGMDKMRADIQEGIDSGPATPLDMAEVKAEGCAPERLAASKG